MLFLLAGIMEDGIRLEKTHPQLLTNFNKIATESHIPRTGTPTQHTAMRTVTTIELMAEVTAMAVLANRVFINAPFFE